MINLTIYIISNPLGVPAHAFTDEKDAKKEMVKMFTELGEKYTLDRIALTIDELFLKRVQLLLPNED